MSLTLLALFIIPFHLYPVVAPNEAHAAFKTAFKDDASRICMSFGTALLALVILADTGLTLSWSLEGILPAIGVLIALKAFFILFAPEMSMKMLKRFTPNHYPFLGLAGMVFALLLVLIDSQM